MTQPIPSAPTSKSITLPDGRVLSLETGKLAKLADGAVVLRLEETVLLATVVAKSDPDENPDFLPFSVDYQERFAAAGKIPGSFFRREGRLSDHEVLISRLVDRALRPLFPSDYFISTQVNILLLSVSKTTPPDSLAALAASAALCLSGLPLKGPVSEVRVVKTDGAYHVNPSYQLIEEATLDLIVAADKDNILMVEGESKEVGIEEVLEALKVAHEAIRHQCQLQEELLSAVGASKRTYKASFEDQALYELLESQLSEPLKEVASRHIFSKEARGAEIAKIKESFLNNPGNEEVNRYQFSKCFRKVQKKVFRKYVLDTQKRIDGRSFSEIRPISVEIDYLPAAHGSALFTRGETQALATTTLGTKLDEQLIDGATVAGTHRFMLHYNFPGFSTGEVKPKRGPARREVGHGHLAQRAIKQVLPQGEDNPYTIRIVSDVLESNGSSSMATVCAGSLSLMDAGVATKSTVAGIAMGLILDEKSGKYAILSDILGDEDQLGDMDFKITSTRSGITACQMDIKLQGLSYEILKEALTQAHEGASHIINIMEEKIPEARQEPKSNTPRVKHLTIPREMIGALIGPGGKIVQEIQRETSTQISIEDKNNEGSVSIFAPTEEALEKARERIDQIIAVPDIGATYTGKVDAIMPYGAFVEFLPGKTGLLHISEITLDRLESMDGVLSVGEEVQVQLVNVDKKTGKYRLSRKALLSQAT